MFIKKFKNKLTENSQKVISNIIWAVGGKIVNMLGALFVGILVARYLGPDQYGLMNYVISFVTLFSILANFGLDNIEIRELSKQTRSKEAILGTSFMLRLIFASIAYILIFITVLVFKSDIFTSVMIMTYALTVYSGCFNIIRNYFTSIVQNEYVVKSEIFRTLIGAFIKIILLLLKAQLALFIIATLFDTMLVASGYLIAYNKKVGNIKNWNFDRNLVSYLIKESFPLVLSGAAVIIYQRIDQVMIKNMIDNQSVGYFATAGKFVDLILFLPMIFTQTVTPLLVRKREENTIEYETMKQRFVSITVWLSIIISFFVSITAYWLIKYTYGNEYLLAVPVLQIMAWKTVGMALSTSSGQIIIMEGIQKWAVVRNITGMVICIGLNLLIIPIYGIIGSAWVTIITVFVSGYLAHYFILPYRNIADIQLKALFLGWTYLTKIKLFFKS